MALTDPYPTYRGIKRTAREAYGDFMSLVSKKRKRLSAAKTGKDGAHRSYHKKHQTYIASWYRGVPDRLNTVVKFTKNYNTGDISGTNRDYDYFQVTSISDVDPNAGNQQPSFPAMYLGILWKFYEVKSALCEVFITNTGEVPICWALFPMDSVVAANHTYEDVISEPGVKFGTLNVQEKTRQSFFCNVERIQGYSKGGPMDQQADNHGACPYVAYDGNAEYVGTSPSDGAWFHVFFYNPSESAVANANVTFKMRQSLSLYGRREDIDRMMTQGD